MKKYTLSLIIGLFALVANAATLTVVLPPNAYTNVPVLQNGTLRVTQFVITAGASSNASFQAWDVPSTNLTFVNPAYTNVTSYVTNYTINYTNYYGVNTFLTNKLLVDQLQANPATTNNYPIRFSGATLASTSARFDQVSYYFNDGLYLTNNSGTGTATISITYQQ